MGINPDAIALQPHSKEDVGYRQYESCKTCGMFNGRSKCNLVRGNISPDAVCDRWILQEIPSGKTGKEIIENEYNKSKGTA